MTFSQLTCSTFASEPGWVAAIKQAARARARARAVAQVQANIDDEHQKGSLKVVNGNPDSLISLFTDQAEHGAHVQVMSAPVSEQARTGLPPVSPMPLVQQDPMDDVVIVHDEIPYRPILPPPALRMNTANTVIVRSPNALRAMEAEAANDNSEALSSPGDLSPFPVRPPLPTKEPKPFKPSLETVEKSVATKIYLENHYYGILKRPRDRDQRRAALERELASANTTDAQRRKIRSAWILSETEHLRSLRNRVTVNSFQKIKTIGHGAFGVVSLVKERGTGELYAMKQLRKADMLRKGQEGHVRAERDVMSAASSNSNCKWIVRLLYSFQDVDHLYLVMEYMGGGDLLNLLIEKDTFEEGFTKFYVAEMVLAIQEAHKLGYIHRDVKVCNSLARTLR
jgi:protein-serine/threonine kinase